MARPPAEERVVGRSVPNIDAAGKVTGRAKYGSDLRLPGMLYGQVLRSPVAHARVTRIDVSRARNLPGIKAVLTGTDAPAHRYGSAVADENLLAREKVRYAGNEVAVVVGTDLDVVQEALDLVRVEYEELPVTLDPLQALTPGAAKIHDAERNTAAHFQIQRGNVDEAFRQAERVFEDEFRTSLVYQAYLEPTEALAEVDSDGRAVLWAGIQDPSSSRMTYSRALGISPEKLRIVQPFTGGGFGGKLEPKLPVLAVLAALRLGRPVKLASNRHEDFLGSQPRVPMIIRLRLAYQRDGTITAKDVQIVADNGAYTRKGPSVLLTACYRIDALYRIPTVRAQADLVYTNKIPTGAFRGYGNPQMHFAMESAMDMMAEDLSMDPIELRLKNAAVPGYVNPHGWQVGSCAVKECVEEVRTASGWDKQAGNRHRRALGIGCCVHVSGNRSARKEYDGSSALVRLDPDGTAHVYSGEADIGQGSRTVLAQIAAETLGFPLSRVRMAPIDTDISPHAWGTFASRVTYLGGNAVKAAALDAKARLLAFVAQSTGLQPGMLDLQEGKIVFPGPGGKLVPVEQYLQEYTYKDSGSSIVAQGSFVPNVVYPDASRYGNISGAYSYAAQVAEVEVDQETGRVQVLNVWAAHDVGRAINPALAAGQVEGGIAFGLGWALTEEVRHDARGSLRNGNFVDYKLPTAEDMPEIQVSLVESNEKTGPYGAKSVGELTLIPTAPAIANAIYRATGVRIKELPITPEKILAGLKARGAGQDNR